MTARLGSVEIDVEEQAQVQLNGYAGCAWMLGTDAHLLRIIDRYRTALISSTCEPGS